MSRVGKKPIEIPQGVEVKIEGNQVYVKGPKGEEKWEFHPDMEVKIENNKIVVKNRFNDKFHKALHGTTRQLIANMIKGVTEGFVKELEIHGMGYKVEQKKGTNKIILSVGYSKKVEYEPPPESGVKIEVKGDTNIVIYGSNKYWVGEVAAQIRRIRPPDSYKGYGIRYKGERLILKPGKTGKTAG